MSEFSDVLCWEEAQAWSGSLPAEPSRLLMERVLKSPTAAAAKALFEAVLAEDLAPRAGSDHPAVQRMLHAFWSGLHRGVTATDLIRASGIRRSRAWQLFAQAYGVPPHRALLDARRSLAQGLLDAGLAPGQAASRAGFSNAAAFARERRRAQAPRRPSAQRARVPARSKS